MTFEDWGQIGQIAEAAAVIVTLIYLSMQVRHARRETMASNVLARAGLAGSSSELIADSPYLPELIVKDRAGQPLTPEETLRLQGYLRKIWFNVESTVVQQELGVLPQRDIALHVPLQMTLATPFCRDFYRQMEEGLHPGLRRIAEPIVERLSAGS